MNSKVCTPNSDSLEPYLRCPDIASPLSGYPRPAVMVAWAMGLPFVGGMAGGGAQYYAVRNWCNVRRVLWSS
jgi:hypothetical protein